MHVLSTPAPLFRLQIRPQRWRVIVELEGDIDCASEPRIAEALDDLRNVGWDAIVLDIEAVSYIDSTGLRLFLTTDARARREGWRFELHGSCASFERLLSLTGLHDWFRRT